MRNDSDCNDNSDIVAVRLDEGTPSTDESVDILAGQSRRRVLYRVPPQLRDNKKNIYEPVVVPLGPYHHGRKPEFEAAEQIKNEVRDILCSEKDFLLGKILERINDVKYFYGGANGYDDDELAEMMLRDACFLLAFMDKGYHHLICHYLGMSGAFFFSRDAYMLENQIPLWLLNLLISVIYQDEQSQSFLCKFLSFAAFLDDRMKQLPWGNGQEEPLHLLEAFHRTYLRFIKKQESSNSLRLIKEKSSATKVETLNIMNSPFRSVRDLNAKGIQFRRSSPCLNDIQFFSVSFYGQLRLPFFCVTHNTMIFFSNLIAFELSPQTQTDLEVTSYINFMKSLIDTAKDVKVLRERGILHSTLTNDEEVARMFKSIDTHGICNHAIFNDVKMRIDDHCNSKAKTWLAELINTKFRSPWTTIALFAASFLLCLTFLQTYYTLNPRT